MNKTNKSIEEHVEDIAKRQLLTAHVKTYTKTEAINQEIQTALEKAPSKSGGAGANYPDIKVLITSSKMRRIPVMIEVKGKQGDLVKYDEQGSIANADAQGKPLYSNIKKYAVNGAVHYADAIINGTDSYNEVIAIGANGYYDASGKVQFELGVYYVSKDNLLVPKKIGDYTNLSFLSPDNVDELIDIIGNLSLTEEEIENRTALWEYHIEDSLKKLNQEMHDTHNISEDYRVKLISGLIMAGLGTKGVSPLQVADLKGDSGSRSHDGVVIINKIASFLDEKDLPKEKCEMILTELNKVFLHTNLHEAAEDGESRLKKVYSKVYHDILPFFNSEKYHIDFTGKLFNTLNAWVKVPDGNQNDVVLTPRYVCEMMVELCKVNKDSFVWDYAVGSAGFLIAAMKLMVKDAEEKMAGDPTARDRKILRIKAEQLMGIEKLPDIYMLAVLNMILMGDGSTNIIYKDSLKFDGKYEQGEHRGEPFPANVFLLNPPYSADGKGLVFVERALSRMTSGRAAVLIQENAGSGKGLPYSKRILEHSSLLASIHMADIFKGKANVQTAIYLFEVGMPHDANRIVKFINFCNDGYTRQNRRKAKASVNLRDTSHAAERYAELIATVLGNKRQTHYLDGLVYEDTISLNGDDWTVDKHKKIDTLPQERDFYNTISNYIGWKADVLKSTINLTNDSYEKDLKDEFVKGGGRFERVRLSKLFMVKSNPQLDKSAFNFSESSEYPYFTRTVFNNGILGYVDYLDKEHLIKGNCIAVGMMGMQFFYMDHDFYAGQFTKTLFPLFSPFDEDIALYFIAVLNKFQEMLKSELVRNFERKLLSQKVIIPIHNKEIDCSYIKRYVTLIKKKRIEIMLQEHTDLLERYMKVCGFKNNTISNKI